MTQQELDNIVERHQHWLKEDCEGWENMKASLSGADLCEAKLRGANLYGANLCEANLEGTYLEGANLRGANLYGAYLYGASLSGADLCEAKLRGANLRGVNLYKANLEGANLRGANLCEAKLRGASLRGTDLCEANLEGANLRGAKLRGANLSGADLRGTNLCEANLDEKERHRLGKILKEPLIGYKKTAEGVVITAEIPAGAIVFCINGKKCRTNRAKITDMGGKELLHSQHDNSFEYTLGKEIVIEDFNLMYNVECASGFHFFRTKEEAKNY